jgi:hypothetical protein
MNKTIGIMAHVDSGKTTFTERLLFKNNIIRSFGRVDYKESYMDSNSVEKSRGITIFSDVADFKYNNNRYFVIDTPGHIDFSPETERAVSVLDYAILLIDGSSMVQSHCVTLFEVLKKYNIPVFIFINKIDIDSYDRNAVIEDIKNKLSEEIVFLENSVFDIVEFLAERDEEFLEKYLESDYSENDIINSAVNVIKDRSGYVIMEGSSLKDIGIDEFFKIFDLLTQTDYSEGEFKGKVFKICHDEKGNRVTFIKALSGCLNVKDCIEINGEQEKINEIRYYSGAKYCCQQMVESGTVFGVTGLKGLKSGDMICGSKAELVDNKYYFSSALQSKVVINDNTDIFTCLKYFKTFETEEPMLSVNYVNNEIVVNIMGKVQLEVLKQLAYERFGVDVDFEKPTVSYRETIKNTVIGIGHYEPLRHYAEVQLRLEPNKRGEGITYSSECHIDTLGSNYQSLVKTHIFEKKHLGILTGSPITDINIVLQKGKAHLKHTEGGDFREATYRAVRQGLEKAENILLEAFYRFDIYVSEEYLGKVMTDIQKYRGVFEPPVQKGGIYNIKGRGPVSEFMDYPLELMSFTRGMGSMSVMFDGYDECDISEKIIEEIGYDKGADKENTSCSVFCKKGAGYTVNWDEVDSLAHTLG